MSEETQEKSGGGRRPLTLRKTETGAVKQSFSHGRTKTVVVEKKRRVRSPADGAAKAAPPPEEDAPAKPKAPAKAAPTAKNTGGGQQSRGKPKVLRQLSPEEKKKRAVALAQAKKQQEEKEKREAAERAALEKREAEERARLEEARKKAEEEETKRKVEAEARKKAEEEARIALEKEEAERRSKQETKARTAPTDGKVEAPEAEKGDRRFTNEEDNPLSALGGRIKQKRNFAATESKPKEGSKRRTGRLTIAKALEDDERQRSLASVRRAREKEKAARAKRSNQADRKVREVVIPDLITVQELAQRMAMRSTDLIRELMKQGQMVQANATLDADTAQLIVEDLGHSVKRVSESDVEEGLIDKPSADANLVPRPPVVTIMGHVDHGKTSLLDALRQTDVVAGEAGGITQHIGAYQIKGPNGDPITFLDTPGHAAFTAMRARGANVTDIVVIVVAADDGVMPQTIESINHARAAGVPIIVAINKIDKPGVDSTRVKTDLLQHEVQVESMGGEIQDIEVSALKRLNLDGLLEAIQLQAELLELKADDKRQSFGTVVEAKLDKGRGPVTTLLVQEGELQRGDIVVVGAEWGKVRALLNDQGDQVKVAGPSLPVEILGLNGVPEPGDQFAVVAHEARAREVAEYRQRKKREKANAATAGTSLEQMMAQLQDAEIKDLPIVIKGDVQGSVEAIVGALQKMSNSEVRVRILHTGVGAISESDVILAEASQAPVIGFNVRANKQARDEAQRSGTEIRYYSVIYDLIDDIKGTLTGMLDPELRETFLGNAEILEVFNISKVGRVAGCRVTEGQVKRGSSVRLLRDNVVIHEGQLSQLKRFKDDVNEVPAGQECGMSFANYDDLKVGDVIECFDVERVERSLDSVA
ncbi:translation initiation factor IF-2 [Parvularcula bermudensis HTCC2503]|uniref:Translation initiation factor IF-2 n=1 Tax=Parvularcula bermudensis (strain ATCC BAA-594 / HTCC2503 / KCTC 12087) TaxID=314260 RepID=E0TEQ3_PARBH|nr:translation initiation factor IF-2 [Parvularcula bermudensis]ADM08936.1 translation initiation factor IF-2 [Parvularcula bermudensis HTCC2503]